MAFDSYMQFKAGSSWLAGESQVAISTANESTIGSDIKAGNVFEIDDFNFDIEQVLNIGSQSSGAGAGKVTFNPFTVTRKTDRASSKLFTMCCAGQHFDLVSLYLRRAGGGGGLTAAQGTLSSGWTFLRFDFALVAVKTISWSGSDGDESPKEEVAFEYGALQVRYMQQDATGKFMSPAYVGSWNRVNNNDSFSASGITAT
ncbi:MAG: type VI secretion system tube protein Hcp [Acetobacteraceae bacterium]